VLKALASSLLSLVLGVTFLWGGCVSCEQYFMFPGKRQACCNQSGQCQRPGKPAPRSEKQDCNRLPLERTATAHIPTPAVLPTPIAPAIQQFSASVFPSWTREVPPDPSPPDPQALRATFLI
jgi:hypothetical protein